MLSENSKTSKEMDMSCMYMYFPVHEGGAVTNYYM